MKEQEYNLTGKKSEIKWPQLGKVEVGFDVDFVYIMRKDGKFTMPSIAQKMATGYQLDKKETTQALLEQYDSFFAKLADIFKWGYSSKGNFELHLFDSGELDKAVRAKAEGTPIISLDPLMHQGVYEHRVSRGYYLSGTKALGQVSRPGNEPLSLQAENIAAYLNGLPASVSEDDIFSGDNVIASLNELLHHGVKIHKVIPGIQVGKPQELVKMGLIVDPVVEYETTDGTDIFGKLDLGDPRDFLLGASGLVVKLLSGELGRAPYILPFVSTTARASIPAEIEKEFALKVLQANYVFFNIVGDKVGLPLLLKHMDQSFLVLMHQMFGIDPNTEMSQVTAWIMENIDSFWKITKEQGKFQEELGKLDLSKNIVFLDVNGTIFPDNSPNGYIPAEDIGLLKQTITKAKEKGLSVGLCSDSPLPQLKKLSEKLGIDGPIVAENGNILSNKGKNLILNTLPSIDNYKHHICVLASRLKYYKLEDCVAPEFSSNPIDIKNLHWAFGANRETSITVFGPRKLIGMLAESFIGYQQNISIDCNPENNFLAIHPGDNYTQNKVNSLTLLSNYGYNIIIIGNSMSDWVEPETGVQCTFVKGASITPEVSGKSTYISDKPLIHGIIDIIEQVK